MFSENSGVEYLQITGSVQHIVNLWTIHNRQKMTEKQVSEQRSLEGSRGPPVGHPWFRHFQYYNYLLIYYLTWLAYLGQ